MINLFRASIILVLVSVSFAFINQTALALFTGNPLEKACSEGSGTGKNAACDQAKKQKTDPIVGSNGIITTAVNLIAVIAGIGAVVMVVASGIRYVTSGGDPQKAASARAGIFSGLIGVAVVSLAWIIVSFVIKLIS